MASAISKEALGDLEIGLIREFKSTDDRHGYNVQIGGGHTNSGRKWSAEVKKKMSL